MTSFDLVMRFAILEVLLCVIPGPAVLLALATALRRGPRAGFAAVGGVVTGNTIYFVLSGAGVAALLRASYTAFTVLKYAGAAYLAYLGIRALFAREADVPDARADARRIDLGRAFRAGVVTQLSNPKALVFFVAVVPQFIDVHAPVAIQIGVLTLVSQAIEFGVLGTYVATAARVRRTSVARRTSLWIERIGGAALLAIAAGIAREPLGER